MWKRIYLEGRCLRCGMRITVDREDRGHTRDGQWCGPIETDHPFAVPDKPAGVGWMVPWSHGLIPSDIRHRLPIPPPDGQDTATPQAGVLSDSPTGGPAPGRPSEHRRRLSEAL